MVERLRIVGIGHRGDGVAQSPGGAIYVPGTLPGETVEVEEVPGHPDRRRLLHIESGSAERIAPICPHFGVCGGCAVQHWDDTHYRAWKRGLVVEALRQAGLEAPVAELIDAHGEGRRRAVFHARSGSQSVLEVGFAAARTHRIVAIDRCPVLAPGLSGAIKAAWSLAEALSPAKKPLDIAVTASDAGLDVDVRGSGPLKPALITALARIAAKHDLARLTRHGELIALARPPTLRIGKAIVDLPPTAFLQATAEGEAALARLTLAACLDVAKVADLFVGIGPFALRLAERARVAAIDDDEAALTALKRAAAAAQGLKPVETERRDLFRRPLIAAELKGFDAVVFDPPRQGAEAQARELAASRVPVVVAVSCNPATFARDAATLVEAGYRLGAVTPVDQFRYAAHVEIVARLER
ncbi:MAG: class I SAM-dependent RNA methyltransferase [Xanthobacteraceae bacterium]